MSSTPPYDDSGNGAFYKWFDSSGTIPSGFSLGVVIGANPDGNPYMDMNLQRDPGINKISVTVDPEQVVVVYEKDKGGTTERVIRYLTSTRSNEIEAYRQKTLAQAGGVQLNMSLELPAWAGGTDVSSLESVFTLAEK